MEAKGDPHDKYERLVPFLGSAVSLFEPTSLPTWGGFVSLVLKGLESAAGHECRVSEQASDWRNCRTTLDVIVRRLGVKYLEVMRAVLNRPANSVHELFVDNIAKGKYPAILTTNFDRVIEDTLEARGMPVCELRGRDEEEDAKSLDAIMSLPTDKVRTIVVTDPRAFGALDRMPGVIGRENTCLYMKLHGDAKYPTTCVDTDVQRELGLPAAVRSTLSILLRRFPMFFVGWGGGDLEGNSDYVRLESEADSAKVYWLIMPGSEPPAVLKQVERAFQSKGGKFDFVEGTLKGTRDPNSSPFEQGSRLWAKNVIGAKWASLVLSDLERVYSSPDDDSTDEWTRMKQESKLEASKNSFWPSCLVPLAENASFSHKSKEMLSACLESLLQLQKKHYAEAWSKAVLAVKKASTMLPEKDLRFADSWVPFAVASLVQACHGGDMSLAHRLWRDAHIAARQSGNLNASTFLSQSDLETKLEQFMESQRKPVVPNGPSNADDATGTKPLQVFLLDLDNVGKTSTSGLPQHLQIRAELFRGFLTGDLVVIPKQSLLNSRALVTEVLSDCNGIHGELLNMIQPMLESDAENVKQPLLYKRKQLLEDPNFLHEDIPNSFFEQMQVHYDSDPCAPKPMFYSVGPIAKNYTIWVRLILQDQKAVKYAGGESAQSKACAEQVFPSLSRALTALSHNGDRGLTRSDIYRWGNLFSNNPFSDQDVWNHERMDDEAKEIFGSEAEFCSERQKVLARPWRNAQLIKNIADGAYVTNLPIHLRLSMLINPEEDTRMLRLVQRALDLSKAKTRLPTDPFVAGSIDSVLLASVTVDELVYLRNSDAGRAFRSAAKEYRDAGTPASRKQVKSASQAFLKFIKTQVTLPSERVLPARLKATKQHNPLDLSDEMIKETGEAMLKGFVAHMAMPPPPLYDSPRMAFPSLLVLMDASHTTPSSTALAASSSSSN